MTKRKRDEGTSISTSSKESGREAKRARARKRRVEESQQDEDKYYAVRQILGERKGQYLIDWEDDPVTGEKFDPSWQPKENATNDIVDIWQARSSNKNRRKQEGKATSSIAVTAKNIESTKQKRQKPIKEQQQPKRLTRTRLRVDSSPLSEEQSPVKRIAPKTVNTPKRTPRVTKILLPKSVPEAKPEDNIHEPVPVIEIPESQLTPAASDQSDSVDKEDKVNEIEDSLASDQPTKTTVLIPSLPPNFDEEAYEKVTFSQIFSRSLEPHQDTPQASAEPSQWVPDLFDNSKTTIEETESSIPHPTLSELETPPAPTSCRQITDDIDSDSQNFPGSASYVIPAETQGDTEQTNSTGPEQIEAVEDIKSSTPTEHIATFGSEEFGQALSPSQLQVTAQYTDLHESNDISAISQDERFEEIQVAEEQPSLDRLPIKEGVSIEEPSKKRRISVESETAFDVPAEADARESNNHYANSQDKISEEICVEVDHQLPFHPNFDGSKDQESLENRHIIIESSESIAGLKVEPSDSSTELEIESNVGVNISPADQLPRNCAVLKDIAANSTDHEWNLASWRPAVNSENYRSPHTSPAQSNISGEKITLAHTPSQASEDRNGYQAGFNSSTSQRADQQQVRSSPRRSTSSKFALHHLLNPQDEYTRSRSTSLQRQSASKELNTDLIRVEADTPNSHLSINKTVNSAASLEEAINRELPLFGVFTKKRSSLRGVPATSAEPPTQASTQISTFGFESQVSPPSPSKFVYERNSSQRQDKSQNLLNKLQNSEATLGKSNQSRTRIQVGNKQDHQHLLKDSHLPTSQDATSPFRTQVSLSSAANPPLGATPRKQVLSRQRPDNKNLLQSISFSTPSRNTLEKYSSPIPNPVSQSVTLTGSAPAEPKTLQDTFEQQYSTPSRMSTSSQVLDSSAKKLKELSEKRKARFANFEMADSWPPPTPGLGENSRDNPNLSQPVQNGVSEGRSSQQPPARTASHTLPNVTVEPPSAIPPHMVTPFNPERSPSVVPAEEPIPAFTLEEQNTSERFETLLPQSSIGRDASLRRLSSTHHSDDLELKQNREHPHVVPIALISRQRDHYISTVFEYRDRTERFLNGDESLAPEMKQLLDRAKRVALHPDLDNFEAMTQFDVGPSQQAEWDVQCSSKFSFLKDLLDQLRDQPFKMAIIASDPVLIILDKFLDGIEISHKRAIDTWKDEDGIFKTALKVDIVSSEIDLQQMLEANLSPNLIIALEWNGQPHSELFETLRQPSAEVRPPVIITLVIPSSVEHVEMSMSSVKLSPAANLKSLVGNIISHDRDVGKLQEYQNPPFSAASAIAHFVLDIDSNPEWPLHELDPLDDLDLETESETDPQNTANVGVKRAINSEDVAEDSNKKVRLHSSAQVADIPMTINPAEMDLTKISDSIGNTNQQSANSGEGSLIKLQAILKQVRHDRDEHKQAIEELQYRYEEQFQQLHNIRQERDKLLLGAHQVTERTANIQQKLEKIKEERDSYRKQLQDAETSLALHSVPARAELESTRQEVQRANDAQAKAEARLQGCQRELDFFRDQYQEASRTASRLAAQEKDLTSNLVKAQAMASGEQARLRQMSYDAQFINVRTENQQLRAYIHNLETILNIKEDEIAKLKEAGRGRIGTRGSSIPRSPRLGSPMKIIADGDIHTPRGPVGRSRQGSPSSAGDINRGRASSNLNPARTR